MRPILQAQIDQAIQRMRTIDAMTERASEKAPGGSAACSSAPQQAALLTPLGEHIVGFPCSPLLGKLLLYGAILGCAAPASAIAACVSVRDPFLSGAPGTPEGEATKSLVQAAKQKYGNIQFDYLFQFNS
jgi:ATP-dependent RNA helicase DHX36